MVARLDIDRLSIRQRPPLLPVMYQSWHKLLFLHWSLAPEVLRPHVPYPLEIDTFDGQAWIGITPFVVRRAHPVFMPPLPLFGDFNEINVRTYVHFDGVPGVWFFSLDADSLIAVKGARSTYRLPYHTARMSFREEGRQKYFRSRRTGRGSQPEFEVAWSAGQPLGQVHHHSREFFLIERYCLYAVEGHRLYRARIHHPPWNLRKVQLDSLRSSMIELQGLPPVAGPPLLHYAERQDVAIWPLKRVEANLRVRLAACTGYSTRMTPSACSSSGVPSAP